MRIIYTLLGVLLISTAAMIYGAGPRVDFASSHYVARFVALTTPMFSILGVVLVVMAILRPQQKEIPKTADKADKSVKAVNADKADKETRPSTSDA
ncbi:MAG: hypothetical protein V3S44_08710 [Alphaproteobacteria bacterium]